MTMTATSASPTAPDTLSQLLRERRSTRDFLPRTIAPELLQTVLADAAWSPSWSNTQPYRIAVASGTQRDELQAALCQRYDLAMRAQKGGIWGKLKMLVTHQGLPDGDYVPSLDYPADLQAQRRATGYGLYQLLGIARQDDAARTAQMRKNFEFFGAPTVLFLFAHAGLKEFAILDTGIYLQSLMLSAHAHGLATCAQGALATWAGPVRETFNVPKPYKLICGVSIGYATSAKVNHYNPGRQEPGQLQLELQSAN